MIFVVLAKNQTYRIRNRRTISLASPKTTMKVPFFRHGLTRKDAESIADVLETPFLTSGKVGQRVEAQIAEFFDVPSSLLTNSWTNGAITTLMALGIGRDDEVIVPAMTFISSVNVVEMVGATPVFVDVNPDTLLIEPEKVRAAITARTKAIIPVHLYGQMCDMPALVAAIAERDDISIIEDAAHCFEGTRDGYKPATYGDVAIFSFYATKNITCGEGGAIAIKDQNLLEPLRQARLHGMTADAINRYQKNQYKHWDMVRLGCKANMPDILAALLPNQITAIKDTLSIRQNIAKRYRQAFINGPLRQPVQLDCCNSAEHAFVIHMPPSVRDTAISRLNDADIGVGVHFRSVPSTTYYREKYGFEDADFPVSSNWGRGAISLPLYPGLSNKEQDYVIRIVRDSLYPLCN